MGVRDVVPLHSEAEDRRQRAIMLPRFFTKKAEGRGQKAKGKKGKKNFSRGCYCPREKEKSLCA